MKVGEPRQFGKYQLLDKIATGGMAELYRAKLTGFEGFEKLIAIKKILGHLSKEENLVQAFIEEAKLAALLHHENIIQIYDFGSMDGEYFIAMEYLFGKDLRHIVQTAAKRKQPMGMENAFYVACQVCAGLDYSHNLKDLQGKPLNMIHRDINPQNIFITYEGQVKIIDFGIAKAASHNTTTAENLIKGKIAYMSPEQAMGQTIDHRSDIFSTGIILYELLADRRMFEGDTLQVLSFVRDAHYDPPQDVISDLSPKLAAILERALAKEPENRYGSCGEMLADLEECAYQLSLRPNARSFARYMRELFEEEVAEEELALWAKNQTDATETPGRDKNPTRDHGPYEDTILLPSSTTDERNPVAESFVELEAPQRKIPFLAEKLRRLNSRYVGLILWLIFLLALVILGLKNLPFARHQPEVSVLPAQTASVTEAAELAKLSEGKAALQAKHYARAAALFEELLIATPSMRKTVSTDYVNALQGQAANLVEKAPQEAERILLKALAIEPGNIAGLSQLGYLYLHQKDYPRAIQTYQKLVELDPLQADTFFNLGYVYAITKEYHQAKAMYIRVVELAPAFTDEALFNLAFIHEKLGEHDQCIKRLEHAIELNPGNESARNYLERLKQPPPTGDKG